MLSISVSAIQISPGLVQEQYSPGALITQTFTISDISGDKVQLGLSGDFDDMTLSTQEIIVKPGVSSYTVEVSARLPEDLRPGKSELRLNAKDLVASSGQIVATGTISGRVEVERPYPKEFILVDVAYDSRQKIDSVIPLTVSVKSLGQEAFDDTAASIEIFDQEAKLVSTIDFSTGVISSGQSRDVIVNWDATGMQPGKYSFNVHVKADGADSAQIKDHYIFLGDELLSIVGITPDTIAVNQISDVKVEVKSEWSSPMQFFATLTLTDENGKKVLETQSAQSTVTPFGVAQADIFINSNSLGIGSYDANVQVTYGDAKSVLGTYRLQVLDAASVPEQHKQDPVVLQESQTSFVWVYVVILIVLVIVAGYFIWKEKVNKMIQKNFNFFFCCNV